MKVNLKTHKWIKAPFNKGYVLVSKKYLKQFKTSPICLHYYCFQLFIKIFDVFHISPQCNKIIFFLDIFSIVKYFISIQNKLKQLQIKSWDTL